MHSRQFALATPCSTVSLYAMPAVPFKIRMVPILPSDALSRYQGQKTRSSAVDKRVSRNVDGIMFLIINCEKCLSEKKRINTYKI